MFSITFFLQVFQYYILMTAVDKFYFFLNTLESVIITNIN